MSILDLIQDYINTLSERIDDLDDRVEKLEIIVEKLEIIVEKNKEKAILVSKDEYERIVAASDKIAFNIKNNNFLK